MSIPSRARAAVGLVPRPVLLVLIAAGLGYGGYRAVQFARFEYHYSRAAAALDREAFEEAGEHLGRCLRINPDSGRAHFLAARAARRSGQYDLSAEELTAAADLGWPEPAVRLERALAAVQQQGLDPAAEESLRGYVTDDNPDRYVVLEALAQGYLRTYRLPEARECLDVWVSGKPDSIAARMKRGWVYERLGRVEDAEADYRAVLDRYPNQRPARGRLGQVLVARKKFADAVPLLEPLRTGATDPADDLALARAYAGVGRTDEARTLLTQLDATRPADPAAPLELGKLALSLGHAPEARDWFQKAIGRAPEEYEPHYQMFLALKHLGDESGAAREEQKFKEIDADLRRMSELTTQLQARPNDADLKFRIAEVFFRRGEGAEGAVWLEQVVRADPGHAKARAMLADYYDRIGRPDRARGYRGAAVPSLRESPARP